MNQYADTVTVASSISTASMDGNKMISLFLSSTPSLSDFLHLEYTKEKTEK